MVDKQIVAICYSDLHLENWKRFNEGNRRLKNGIDVIRKMALASKEDGVPILFAGDLFHKEKGLTNELMAEALPKVIKLLSSGNTTFAITGNHDQSKQNTPDNESPSYIKTLSKICKNLDCIDFKSTKLGNIGLHGIPYLTHDIGLVESINKIEFTEKKNILMIHTTMPGARDTDGREIKSHIETKAFYKAIERFDLIITGHIHKPDSYKVNGVQVIQVGAPQQQRLTDRNCEMGYWEIYKDLSFKFIPFKGYPKFIEIDDPSQKLDNNNFYVIREKARNAKDVVTEAKNKFNNKMDKTKLATNYCKEKSIKDKSKRIALQQALKSVE